MKRRSARHRWFLYVTSLIESNKIWNSTVHARIHNTYVKSQHDIVINLYQKYTSHDSLSFHCLLLARNCKIETSAECRQGAKRREKKSERHKCTFWLAWSVVIKMSVNDDNKQYRRRKKREIGCACKYIAMGTKFSKLNHLNKHIFITDESSSVCWQFENCTLFICYLHWYHIEIVVREWAQICRVTDWNETENEWNKKKEHDWQRAKERERGSEKEEKSVQIV